MSIPQCDGDCGKLAAPDGRGGYRMLGGLNFWCGNPKCGNIILQKIKAGHAAYDQFRREQLAIDKFNESGKEI